MRLIDADWMKEIIKREMQQPLSKWQGDALCRLLDDAPAVVVVPPIQCMDCAYHDEYDRGLSAFETYLCGYHNRYTALDDFCSEAKRKGDT